MTDDLLNLAAVGGAVLATVLILVAYARIEDAVCRLLDARRAAKAKPRIVFRVGYGPPNKTRQLM